jgi:8-oxo-dGTP pyrophosphatase MutT (NUDIX family)
MPLAQASAIPFRWRDGALEFCFITSIRARRWGFPKGLIDPGETAVEAALKEAWEEAGLRGEIVGDALGSYQYEKWGERLDVEVFVMRVQSAADDWQESAQRERRWAGLEEAMQLITGDKRERFLPHAIELARTTH